MASRIGLRVVLCVSSQPAPGTPERLRQIRDQAMLDAINAARAAVGGRFTVFAPGVGAGRALRLASTSVVVDDAYALTELGASLGAAIEPLDRWATTGAKRTGR